MSEVASMFMDGQSVPREEVVRATRAVTEHRVVRYPLPTSTSTIVDLPLVDVGTNIHHFTAINAHFGERANLIGVYYDWIYRRDIEATSLLALDDVFRHHGFKSVLVPVVYRMKEALAGWFDRCEVVRCVEIREPSAGAVLSSDYFYYDHKLAENQLVINASNFLSSQIFDHLKRIAHVMLSDEAAPTYNESYGGASFGTSTYMRLESTVLENQISLCRNKERAVELGCGTGRHTFRLAETFREVHGYDFSSKMIQVAQSEKQRRGGHEMASGRMLRFHTRDIEMFPPGETGLDLVAGLFGMGSFVEDLDSLLSNCQQRLADGGRVILSFYNRAAAVYTQPPPWRYPALAAQLDNETDELLVRLSPTVAFRIYCRAWSVAEVQEKMNAYFDDVRCITLPKVGAVFPRDYPMAETPLAEDIYKLELQALNDQSYTLGPYILASGTRRGSEVIGSFYEHVSETRILEIAATNSSISVADHFFERTQVGLNIQPILGHARVTIDGRRRTVPVVIIKPWSAKLDPDEIKQLMRSYFGRSRAFTFLDRDLVNKTYGTRSGDVPVGVLHSRVFVIYHPALELGGPYRARFGGRVIQCDTLEALRSLVGGRIGDAEGAAI